MEVKIAYETNYISAQLEVKNWQISEAEAATIVENDYRARLEQAVRSGADPATVERRDVQEIFDELGRSTKKTWRKEIRRRGRIIAPEREDGSEMEDSELLEQIPDPAPAVDFRLLFNENYEKTCAIIRATLSADSADTVIAVVIDRVTPAEYAASAGLKLDTVYKRCKRGLEKLKNFF